MGTCYKLIAVDVRRTLDLDKFYNRRSAYEALTTLAPWGDRGCHEVTPTILRSAAERAARATPSSDEDADDVAYGAEKLLHMFAFGLLEEGHKPGGQQRVLQAVI